MLSRTEPIIVQGGMGVAVSAWPLARAVSLTGQLRHVARFLAAPDAASYTAEDVVNNLLSRV